MVGVGVASSPQAARRSKRTRRQGDRETRRQGDKEIGDLNVFHHPNLMECVVRIRCARRETTHYVLLKRGMF